MSQRRKRQRVISLLNSGKVKLPLGGGRGYVALQTQPETSSFDYGGFYNNDFAGTNTYRDLDNVYDTDAVREFTHAFTESNEEFTFPLNAFGIYECSCTYSQSQRAYWNVPRAYTESITMGTVEGFDEEATGGLVTELIIPAGPITPEEYLDRLLDGTNSREFTEYMAGGVNTTVIRQYRRLGTLTSFISVPYIITPHNNGYISDFRINRILKKDIHEAVRQYHMTYQQPMVNIYELNSQTSLETPDSQQFEDPGKMGTFKYRHCADTMKDTGGDIHNKSST